MSSSTASERTINTSTESANTVLTNVTVTDGDTTEDSLDHEPPQDILISLDSASSMDSKSPSRHHHHRSSTGRRSQNNYTKLSQTPDSSIEKQTYILDSEICLAETPFVNETRKLDHVKIMDDQKAPSTAPPGYHQGTDTRFPFDECGNLTTYESQSAKEPRSIFDSAGSSPNHRNTAKFVFDVLVPTSPTEPRSPDLLLSGFDMNEKPPKSPKASSSKNETKFSFEGFPLPTTHRTKRHSTDSRSSQKARNRKSSIIDNKSATPPLPDLRVDFFSDGVESQERNKSRPSSCLLQTSEDMNKLRQELEGTVSGHQNRNSSSRRPSATRGYNSTDSAHSPSININVTTNPLDNGAGCCNLTCPAYANNQYRCCACCSNNVTQNANRKIPQATIVVQQASLSLDYSNVSTILLKDENDFVSNTSPSSMSGSHHKLSVKKKKQRDEHMKQLLDVTNQLTQEEIHDFEMRYGSPHHSRSLSVSAWQSSSRRRSKRTKYGSPHHSRSQSVKAGVGGWNSSGRSLLGPPPQRARVASMPSTGVEEHYYRLRHFSITGKGVVNRGDSLKSRRSRSNNSVASSNSSTEHLAPRASAPPSLASSRESSASAPPPAPYRVLVLGAPGVGKSSLVSQFMTSEYLHAYDTSIDDDSGEKSVSVLLAGEESELVFLDQACCVGPDAEIEGPEPHAYCVVYSTSERGSLRAAEGWLRALRANRPARARILVGNKADLVRSRAVTTEEGKSLAISYDCKFIETSVGINHNVDELLVGLLTQIRLKQEQPEKRRRGGSARGATPGTGSAQSTPRKQRGARLSASLKVRGLLGRVWARDSKSKSCENLHVL